MSSNFMNRLRSWVSGDPFEDDVFEMENEIAYRPERHEPSLDDIEEYRKPKKSAKVVDHPAANKSQVVVIEPRAFEESLEIIEHLRGKKSVILNLHLLDTAQSQRVVDFLSGATHAIDGHQQRIGDGVFIFTPNSVNIHAEADEAPAPAALEDAFWKQSY